MGEERGSLRVWGLGSFIVKVDDKIIYETEWKSSHALKLFKYLLINFGQAVPAERLVDLFWPDYDFAKGKKRLYDTIYKLRNILDRENNDLDNSYIIKNFIGYMLNTNKDYWFDWQEFSKQYWKLKSAPPSSIAKEYINEMESAISLYRDEFMSADCYEPWTEFYREQYRSMYLDVIQIAGRVFLESGKFTESCELLKRGIKEEPYCEEFYLLTMKALKEENRFWEAVKIYKKYEKLIKEELNIEPSSTIKELYQKLLQKTKSGPVYETWQDSNLNMSFENGYGAGAFLCNKDVFKTIYEMEQRRVQRSKVTSLLLLVRLTEKINFRRLKNIVKFLSTSLRSADVITIWDESEIFILYYNAASSCKDLISKRLEKSLNQFEFSKVEYSWEIIDGKRDDKKDRLISG